MRRIYCKIPRTTRRRTQVQDDGLRTQGFVPTHTSPVFCTLFPDFVDILFHPILFFPQRQQIVALNHYELNPRPRTDYKKSDEGFEIVDSKADIPTTIIDNVESHDNAGFEHSKEHHIFENKLGEGKRQEIAKTVEKKLDKEDEEGDNKAGTSKDRRVRFDLRGVKEKNERKEKKEKKKRRLPMGQIPDIIVNTESGARSGSLNSEKSEGGRAAADDSDDGENSPADITAVFEDPRKIRKESGNLAQNPAAADVSAVSDEEGTVVEI